MELKVWPREFEPLQLPWHIDATRQGAICYVIAYVTTAKGYWVGPAEEYQRHLDLKKTPRAEHLHTTLNVIYSVLTGCTMQSPRTGTRGERKYGRQRLIPQFKG